MSTTKTIERIETEVQAAARRKGLTMGQLAARMGVTIGYLSQIANGHRRWTPRMRAKVIAVLGEVPRPRQGPHPAGVGRRREHVHPRARPRAGSHHA